MFKVSPVEEYVLNCMNARYKLENPESKFTLVVMEIPIETVQKRLNHNGGEDDAKTGD